MLKASWLVAVALALAGCSADNLYIAHKTNLGLNVAYNQAKPAGKLVFGYKEKFLTVIPKSAPFSEDSKAEFNPGPNDREAMSVLSCSDVLVHTIEIGQYTEYLATGAAARAYARKLVALQTGAPSATSNKLFAKRLDDTLTETEAVITEATKEAEDDDVKAKLGALKEKTTAAKAEIVKLDATADDQVDAKLDLLLKNDIKTLADGLAASDIAKVQAAGKELQLTAAKQIATTDEINSAIDPRIFSCFKKNAG